MQLLNSVFLAWIEGLALIASPCILPILPIILAGSLAGGKKRPIGIIIGFILVFALFTFFSRKLVLASGIDLGLVRNIAYGLLLLFGVIMFSSSLTAIFARFTQSLATVGSDSKLLNEAQGGLLSGLLLGSVVALIWTPCAGPILATVILQTVLQKTNLNSFFIIIAFAVGAGLPMLLIALLGRGIMKKLNIFKTNAYYFRKILGLIIIISTSMLIYSDSKASFLDNLFATSSNATSSDPSSLAVIMHAPPIEGIEAWINSKPLTLEQLKGKVVLIDFWAYSCINCIRTLPHINKWYEKYHDQGLEIIGIHAPEFDFERKLNNVQNAVTKFGIHYPVALDNNFKTWQNYNNHYWPAHYLINKDGDIVYQNFGEGEYGQTEHNIRTLLGITAAVENTAEKNNFVDQSPETYFGYERANTAYDLQQGVKTYNYPDAIAENRWALQGKWEVSGQKIKALEPNSSIKMHFRGAKVFVVMGNNTNKAINVNVMLNGEKVITNKGKDINNSSVAVVEHRLYDLIDSTQSNSGILELKALDPGLELYTFTFGS